jgi:thiol-disulfide isomerase/thioredoxin
MKIRLIWWQVFVFLWTAGVAFGDELLPILKVGSETYSNVTVTTVSTTDIYFSFRGGMGNAKLKNLSPELQKHFGFNATNAARIETRQRQADALFRSELATRKPAQTPKPTESIASDEEDLVVKQINARSVRGQRPPEIIVDQWLTPAPDMNGKFVLVDFWATWCGPCRASIPHLNSLQAKFSRQLVVIGLTDEAPEKMGPVGTPFQYPVGTDTRARTKSALEVSGIPHAILVDPSGIVRFEGHPGYLNESALARLIAKYGD